MRTYKVLICGGVSTGKSSLLKRFIEKTFLNNIESSKGLDFYIKDLIIDEEKMTLQFWDMGGDEYPKELLQSYAEGTSGVIVTYDTTNSKTLEKSSWWLNILSEILPVNTPYLLVGCKNDLTLIENFVSFSSSPTILSPKDSADIPQPGIFSNLSTDIESSHVATSNNSLIPSDTNPTPDFLDADDNNKVILPAEKTKTSTPIDTQPKMFTIDESAFTKKEDIKTLITKYPNLKLDYIETSAYNGSNVEEAFEMIAKSIKRAEYKFSYL